MPKEHKLITSALPFKYSKAPHLLPMWQKPNTLHKLKGPFQYHSIPPLWSHSSPTFPSKLSSIINVLYASLLQMSHCFQHSDTKYPCGSLLCSSPVSRFSPLNGNLVSLQFKTFSPTFSLSLPLLEWLHFYKIFRNLLLIWSYISIQIIFFPPISQLVPSIWESILKPQILFIKLGF